MEGFVWLVTLLPVVFLLYMGWRSGRHMKGVVDFLASGRACGRYMLTASYEAQTASVLGIIGAVEVVYSTGYGMAFWNHVYVPIMLVLSLTGFAFYRFRETRALSLGQFLEVRYSKTIRIYGACMRTFSDILLNSIGPAISARFFICLLDLPKWVTIWGFKVKTYEFGLLIAIVLALIIIWFGGQLSVNVTDTIQSLIGYTVLIFFSVYFLMHFDWSEDVVPVLTDRVPTESFVNPFDVTGLRDFNLFALFVGLLFAVLNRANYIGGGFHGSARSPLEQKMSGVLGTWRSTVNGLFGFLIGILLIVTLNSQKFAEKAKVIRDHTVRHVTEEIVTNDDVRQTLLDGARALPVQRHVADGSQPLSRERNLDTPYLEMVSTRLAQAEQANQALDGNGSNAPAKAQEFRTLYFQSTLPVMLRNTLHPLMLGLLCAMLIMMMITTDDSRILYNSMTIVQDIIMPFRKTPLSPKNHIRLLRTLSVVVGGIFFLFASCLSQLDYIVLFMQIISAIWTVAASPIMLGGLYSRFGTSFGAFCALFFGGGFAIASALVQRFWAQDIYPYLDSMGWTETLGNFLETVSSPMNPLIVWKMTPEKFPINSVELAFIATLVGWSSYVIGSLLTYKKPYDLDKMLHRDKKEKKPEKSESAWRPRNLLKTLVGITPEYTKGDRIIAWSAFAWAMGYGLFGTFILVLIWNFFSEWSAQTWSNYLLITSIVVPTVMAVVIGIWFTCGAIKDLRHLFKYLAERGEPDPEDDGRGVQK